MGSEDVTPLMRKRRIQRIVQKLQVVSPQIPLSAFRDCSGPAERDSQMDDVLRNVSEGSLVEAVAKIKRINRAKGFGNQKP